MVVEEALTFLLFISQRINIFFSRKFIFLVMFIDKLFEEGWMFLR